MKTFGGNVITDQYVQTLKEVWNEKRKQIPMTYENFIRSNTGWTHEEFIAWVANGRLP